MVFNCPKGTKKMFRFKETSTGKVRLGGCGKRGRFLDVKEVKKFQEDI